MPNNGNADSLKPRERDMPHQDPMAAARGQAHEMQP
jgi:hypothetical protein